MFSDLEKKLKELFGSPDSTNSQKPSNSIKPIKPITPIMKMPIQEHGQPYNQSSETQFQTVTNMCVRQHGQPYMTKDYQNPDNIASYSSSGGYSVFSEFIPDNTSRVTFMVVPEHGQPFNRNRDIYARDRFNI